MRARERKKAENAVKKRSCRRRSARLQILLLRRLSIMTGLSRVNTATVTVKETAGALHQSTRLDSIADDSSDMASSHDGDYDRGDYDQGNYDQGNYDQGDYGQGDDEDNYLNIASSDRGDSEDDGLNAASSDRDHHEDDRYIYTMPHQAMMTKPMASIGRQANCQSTTRWMETRHLAGLNWLVCSRKSKNWDRTMRFTCTLPSLRSGNRLLSMVNYQMRSNLQT